MCESTTGLGYATVPYKGINPIAVKAITRFIVEDGLQTTILQSDGESAILELLSVVLTKLGRQLPHVNLQTAPQYSHQSQGVVEDYNVDARQISSNSPLMNHLLHHMTWLPNRYLRHSDGKTSYERNWRQQYKQPIINFGEKVYVHKPMAPNVRLYQRNQEQKHEAIWIGRDTATGQHITLTKELGKVKRKRILRLPSDQQIDKELLLQ
eukprot:3451458-Amphidinium_carterae.2